MKTGSYSAFLRALAIASFLSLGMAGTLTGCASDNFEEAGEEIDEAIDEVEDELD